MEMAKRHRILRANEGIRRLVRETKVSVEDLVYPMFITEGVGIKDEVPSMPGIYRVSVDNFLKELEQLQNLGLTSVLLFGIPDKKDEIGSEAYSETGVIQKALREAKKNFPELLLITDVCLCEYTSHGHCGIIQNGEVSNDKSVEIIAKTALSHVQAGADIVAPSDMMDGRVAAIKRIFELNNYTDKAIMSYSAKYASAFYGPFREAAGSKPAFGDRKTYQMDYGNIKEALREVEQDIAEGADIIMVKPALAYLDVVREVYNRFNVPVAAYNVSGEYSMIKAAARNGWIDEKATVLESVTSIKRAGAKIIITYFAKQLAAWLKA